MFAAENDDHVSSRGVKITQEYYMHAPMHPAALVALVFLSAEQDALGKLKMHDLRRFVCGQYSSCFLGTSVYFSTISESLTAQPSTQSPLSPFTY